jgi:hypothetical protein
VITKTSVAAIAERNCNGTFGQFQKSQGLRASPLFLGGIEDRGRVFRFQEELDVLKVEDSEDCRGASVIQDSQAFWRLTSMVAVSSAQSLWPRDQINGGKLRGDDGFRERMWVKMSPAGSTYFR